ncbi:hypothetical protein [Aquibacillus rhizosphaerae]|uniref:DUF4064 domain-containing protein n=1 Tax=Aquibacillus rhizosphaerae TaxID=3051431 RepID=A0ABT7L911_9BACI|nr:hypothetical protein [Aquibacillus sp. LR5S19]MDL4842354.1 hypothetical protein [Aquibacillus sp. LR5S19]
MIHNKLIQILMGVITTLLLSYALISSNVEYLLLPYIQGVLGFIIVVMFIEGLSAFKQKRKGLGLFFIFLTLFMFTVIILNNTITVEGVIPLFILYVLFGVPIGIVAMFAYSLDNKDKL